MKDIPQIIHQTQGIHNDKNSLLRSLSLSQSWRKLHPQWEYKFWSIYDVREHIKTNYPDLEILDKNEMTDRLLLDISRYFILHTEGGLFLDSDFKCIKSFDDIIKEKHCCFSYQPLNSNQKILSHSFVMSEKEHPFLKFIISRLNANFSCLFDEGNTFLNKTYDLYEYKDSINILPHSMINPCSPSEIKLYEAGLISEEAMADFLSEALSICYYCESRTEYINTVGEDKNTDVLYLSSSVGNGGAFRAAHRIHLGLCSVGINSKMLVLNSNLGVKSDLTDRIYLAVPDFYERTGYHNDLKFLSKYPGYSISSHSFAPAMAGMDVSSYIDLFSPKIVQIHWINAGYIRIEDLAKIKKKIVWRLADCWPLTGGCYYFGDCERYMTGCGKCPKLGSEDENDISSEIWQRKENAWRDMDMSIVVPTPWMKQIVEKSTLLKNRRVSIIPNGLNLNEFYPINKKLAREALNIPLDKKIILYGATNAINDPRKGFLLLKEALKFLSEKDQNQYYLVIFGADSRTLDLDITVKFMGYVKDHHILQALYSAADVMVVPSLEEAFGQTVTESMACGTPVVSFLETGPAGIIDHEETGYLAQHGNSDDLRSGIKWILEDSSRQKNYL